MPTSKGSTERGPWNIIGLVVIGLAVAGFAWWGAGRSGAARVEVRAICLQCGVEATAMVGDTPGLEQWPRDCQACNHRQVYMAMTCPICRKPVALKDPEREAFGQPDQCPHCQTTDIRGT